MNRKLILNSYQIKKTRRKKILNFFLYFIVFFALINLTLTFLIFPVRQKSNSMIPDIPKNSVVMILPSSKKIERGELVLLKPRLERHQNFIQKSTELIASFFTAQQFFLSENDKIPGTKQKIRRVVGLPGDTIFMKDYVLYIKTQGSHHFFTEFELTQTPYNVTFENIPSQWDNSIGIKGSFEEFSLGENEYFVLSDNRKSSDDSRLWGIVKNNQFDGKVKFCFYPFNEFKFF